MKLTSILIILLFAFTLAACGGGGGSSSTPDPTMNGEPPTPPTPMAVDLSGLPAGYQDVIITDPVTIMAGMNRDIGDANFACAAGGADCMLSMTDDGMLWVTGGMVTATPSEAAIARKKIDDDKRNTVRMAEVTALTAGVADPDGDGKPGVPDSDDNNELTYERPNEMIHIMPGGKLSAGGADFDAGDELGMNDTNINNDEEFDKVSQSRIDLGNEYEASVYQRTKDKKMDTLTVYSNVAPATSEPWNSWEDWPDGLTAGDEGDVSNQPEDGAKMIYDVIRFGSDPIKSDVVDEMTGSKIPPAKETSRTVTAADDDFSGTLYGVKGEYECTGGCVLARDPDGDLTISGASTLMFKPSETKTDTDDNHMVEGVTPDPDYLVFGYWMQKSETAQGGMKYGVGVFAEGIRDYNLDGRANLDGTATYKGPATGMYAQKKLSVEDGNVVGTPHAAGQFSANASLTAHFGSTDSDAVAVNGSDKISPAEEFTISGTIDNFMNASGDMISDNWSLSLDAAKLADISNDARGFRSDTTGTGSKGKWAGQFYHGPATGDDAPAAEENYPQSVAGEFTGHFTDGHVIGAFGATR